MPRRDLLETGSVATKRKMNSFSHREPFDQKLPELLRLGILAILLLAILLSGCSNLFGPRQMTILIHMIDIQDRWFRERLRAFERENNVELKIISFDQMSEIEASLQQEIQSGVKTIGLVKTPKQAIARLIDQGLMMSLDQAVPPQQLARDLDEYLDEALQGGYVGGKPYLLPRKLEVNTLLYLKSKVERAVKDWPRYRSQVENMFKQHNGYGLPRAYELESDPNQWDWYDLAVVSYYWAQSPSAGEQMPRTAHRGRKYSGTMTEIATKIFQAGGSSEALLFETDQDLEPVYDAFEWEAFYRKNGLYNPSMWEQRWTGGHIWKAMSSGTVFLAFMHQLDAFFIHGVPESGLAGQLDNPEDMGVAVMPKGVSLALDASGRYVREGGRHSQETGWWWGIPTTTPDPTLSYKLARYITAKEFNLEEVTCFGMLPIRKDVEAEVARLRETEGKQWMSDVFETARVQSDTGLQELPSISNWPEIEVLWLEAWYEIVVEGNYSQRGLTGKVDREHIRSVLEPYADRIRELAGEGARLSD